MYSIYIPLTPCHLLHAGVILDSTFADLTMLAEEMVRGRGGEENKESDGVRHKKEKW